MQRISPCCSTLVDRPVGLLQRHGGLAQHCSSQFLRGHRLGKQKALHQIKTHLTHGEKVGSGLHALGYGASAKAIGKVEDLAAYFLLQPVVGAAGDELSIDRDLDKGKVVKSNQRWPIRSKIID